MNKKKVKALVLCAIATMFFTLTACKKCYRCSVLVDEFLFYKGSDSIYASAYINLVDDTIDFYQNLGYQYDTLYFYWTNAPDVCGAVGYKSAIDQGERCYIKR